MAPRLAWFGRHGIWFAPALALVAVTGCGSQSTVTSSTTTTPAPVAPVVTATPNPFATVAFLGDSLTAGYQNGSLLDTQQVNGYASLIAKQANFSLTMPLIASPGYPAVLELTSAGPPLVLGQASGTTVGRDNTTTPLTDFAVPGHTLHELINDAPSTSPAAAQASYTNLVLGTPAATAQTQLLSALALQPTTIFLWIGSNDTLPAISSGSPSSMTPVADFSADFAQLMGTLKSSTTAHLVVANIADITNVPLLTPAALLISEAETMTGLAPAAVSAGLAIYPGDLVDLQGLADVAAELVAAAHGAGLTPLPDADVLTAAEVVTVQSTIASYNEVIAQQVALAGGTLVDMHTYLNSVTGLTINGYTITGGYLGGFFSLDGLHPTNTGYALLANQFIAATNTALHLSTPLVDVSAVARNDPYFGLPAEPAYAASRHIPVETARAVRSADGRAGTRGNSMSRTSTLPSFL